MKRVIISTLIDYREIESAVMVPSDNRDEIKAAMNTRELSKKLVKGKSSNIWSYGINVKHAGDNTGDMIIQFKNRNGGAGDIYIYYDVPVQVYNKFVGTTSLGHYFWKYIRNKYKYSKLTGDKRGKLPNAIN